MLDLQPRVHFHEPDAVSAQAFRSVGDKLDGPCADIIDSLGRAHGGGADRFARCLVHAGGWCFLDHLLVAALQRAIPLEQVDDIAVGIAEHLHFNMARIGDPFFEQHLIIAETGRSLPLAGQ